MNWADTRKRIRGSLIAITVVVAGSSGARADNLADALVSAYNTSGLLEQNRALLRAADEDVALAISTLRPVIDFLISARHQYTQNGSTGIPTLRSDISPLTAQLGMDWTLYDGGQRNFSIAAARETVLATRQSLVSIEQQVLFRAVAAYLDVLLQQENVSLQQNNLRVLQEEQRASEDRFDVGEVTRTDVALAESRVAAARSNVSTAQGGLAQAKAEYLNAVGRPAVNLAGQPRLPAPPRSVDDAIAVAMRNHPEILAAQHQVASAEFVIEQFNRALGPSVIAGADVGVTNNLDSSIFSNDASVSLTLNQRIYQGGAKLATIRRAMAARDATRANLLNIQRNVRQNLENAYARLLVARATLDASGERVRAAQVAFDGIREEATLGARTTLDVLTAEQELLAAMTDRISARAEQSVASYQLLAAQGLLTAERLQLNVQIYDPSLYYNLAKDAPSRVSKQSKELDRVLKALGKQ